MNKSLNETWPEDYGQRVIRMGEQIAALESGLREIQEIASDYESEREITEWDEGARFLASKILAKLRNLIGGEDE